MSNHEMQFVDPDWQPGRSGQLYGPTVGEGQVEGEEYRPQPVNLGADEQVAAPLLPEPGLYAGGYVSPSPYRQPMTPRPRQRLRSPFALLIIVICIIAAVSFASSSMSSVFHGGSDFGPPFMDHGRPMPAQSFQVNGTPTLVLNGNFGDIQVHTGNTGQVIVRSDDFRGDQLHVDKSSDGKTFTINAPRTFFGGSSSNLDITVPANANLDLTSSGGDITVDGVTGQLSLTNNDGQITVKNSILTGNSLLKTDSGSIEFTGQVDSTGTTQFISNSGSVDVALPANTAVHVDATTQTDSINSDFGALQPRDSGQGMDVHGDLGNGPRARVSIQTNSGTISLHQQ